MATAIAIDYDRLQMNIIDCSVGYDPKYKTDNSFLLKEAKDRTVYCKIDNSMSCTYVGKFLKLDELF